MGVRLCDHQSLKDHDLDLNTCHEVKETLNKEFGKRLHVSPRNVEGIGICLSPVSLSSLTGLEEDIHLLWSKHRSLQYKASQHSSFISNHSITLSSDLRIVHKKEFDTQFQ